MKKIANILKKVLIVAIVMFAIIAVIAFAKSHPDRGTDPNSTVLGDGAKNWVQGIIQDNWIDDPLDDSNDSGNVGSADDAGVNEKATDTVTVNPDGDVLSVAPLSPADTVSDYSSVSGLTVEVVDVGQADCILAYTGDDAMLVDAGNNEDGDLVVDYLQSMGIEHLDYAIGTHAHEDHIGGLDDVIDAFAIDYIMLPLTPSDSATYASVLAAANRSYAEQIAPAEGYTFSLGDAVCTVLCCEAADDEDDLNQSSIVIRLDYGDVSFMFTGDTETPNEEVMLQSGLDLDVDILKVAHHGSYTSSSPEFLKAVSPEVAIISCGEGNDYGHPHDVTLENLETEDAAIYRTDELGTIRVTTDGQTYSISSHATDTDGNLAA